MAHWDWRGASEVAAARASERVAHVGVGEARPICARTMAGAIRTLVPGSAIVPALPLKAQGRGRSGPGGDHDLGLPEFLLIPVDKGRVPLVESGREH